MVGDRSGLVSFAPLIPPEQAKEEEKGPLPDDTLFDEFGFVHAVAHVAYLRCSSSTCDELLLFNYLYVSRAGTLQLCRP